jgi:pyruvate carboxylase
LFGDIVKVTPSSKVVGDMALMMVSQGLTAQHVVSEERDIAFPSSVVEMLRGDLGQPPGGWPKALQRKALKGAKPIEIRPGSLLPQADLAAHREEAKALCGRALNEQELSSYLMYPKVFTEFVALQRKYGPVSALPTSVFFYGMKAGSEVSLEIEPGKTLVVQLTAIGETRDDGQVELFFELNGQPRVITVRDHATAAAAKVRQKADTGNPAHISAPMPGMVSTISVAKDQEVRAGDVLITLEAMKMETVLHAPHDGTVADLLVAPGAQVDSKDLLLELVPIRN